MTRQNPKFTPELLTPELREAFIRQIEKYFIPEKMNGPCLICPEVKKRDYGAYRIYDCLYCPLGNGKDRTTPCVDHSTFILGFEREDVDQASCYKRGKYLIEVAREHGINSLLFDKFLGVKTVDILKRAKRLRKRHKFVSRSPIGCYSFMWEVYDEIIEEVEKLR